MQIHAKKFNKILIRSYANACTKINKTLAQIFAVIVIIDVVSRYLPNESLWDSCDPMNSHS
jgi:hypothetical protein